MEFRDADLPRIGDIVLYHRRKPGTSFPFGGGPPADELVACPAIVVAVNSDGIELQVFQSNHAPRVGDGPTFAGLTPKLGDRGWTCRE